MIALAAAAVLMGVTGATAQASEWQQGDVFLGVESGAYQVRDQNGVLKDTLTVSDSYTTGCALDKQGNFYGTWFGTNQVFKFAAAHPHPSSPFGSNYATPESISFNAAGHVFVGNISGGLNEYDASGTFIRNVFNDRVDFFDISADQNTVIYTQEGGQIQRRSLATGTPLAPFSTEGGVYALRFLPDGGVLAADSGVVHRFNAAGHIIQSYDVAGEDSWFSLNLDPNGTSFWAGDFSTNNYYRFNINTGAVEKGPFNTGSGTQLFGICLKGEITVAGDQTPPSCALTKTGTNGSGKKYIEITVRDTGSGLGTVVVVKSINSDTVVPPFTPGTTSAVIVTSTKIDQTKSSQVELRVTDASGNTTTCDPVLTTLRGKGGKTVTQRFKGLPRAESKIRISNGRPGLRRLVAVVNGKRYAIRHLRAGKAQTLNVAKAMRRGKRNTIVLRGRGVRGSSADIVISD